MAKLPAATADANSVPPVKGGRIKKLALMVGGLLIIISLVAAGLVYSGILHRPSKIAQKVAPTINVFVSVPEIVANLNNDGGSISYIKLKISLAFPDHTVIKPIKAQMPEVVDVVQTFLRSQTRQTLRGKAGTAALRAGIKARLNLLFAPIKLRKVLFEEFIVQ